MIHMLVFHRVLWVPGEQFGVETVLGAHGMINYVDARTSWMDGLVANAPSEGIAQIVIIAAGYCTRAYRLHQPGVKVMAAYPQPCSGHS